MLDNNAENIESFIKIEMQNIEDIEKMKSKHNDSE